MTDLPPGWEWTTLGEIADTGLGKMLDKAKSSGQYQVPYLRNLNVQWGRFNLDDVLTMDIPLEQRATFEIHAGDLLVCEGGEIGRCAIWSGGSSYIAFQKALHRVKPLGGIDSRYLRYLLEYLSISKTLLRFATGSTIKHLPQEQLRRVPVPLPPLAEQRRIVATLEDHMSRLDAGSTILVDSLKRLQRYRDRFIASTMAGTGTWTGRHAAPPEYAGVNDGSPPSIPATWSWIRLGEIADVVGGITKDAKKQADTALPAVPYLRVANVQRGQIKLDDVAMIRAPRAKIDQLSLVVGDVLLNEGGDRDKLARGWVWEGQLPVCIHQNHVFRARIKDDLLCPKLLAWHANSFGKGWAEANGKQSVNLASISLSKIRLLPVPVPPRDEQDALVDHIENHLHSVDRQLVAVRLAQQRATRLRRSLLEEAFAGRLVTQNPDDESASLLLERINAERIARPKAKRARKTKPDQETLL